jgi:hypothetical protein
MQKSLPVQLGEADHSAHCIRGLAMEGAVQEVKQQQEVRLLLLL